MKDSLLFSLKLALFYVGSPGQPSWRGSTPAGLWGPGQKPRYKADPSAVALEMFPNPGAAHQALQHRCGPAHPQETQRWVHQEPAAGLRPVPRLQLRELAPLLDALGGFVQY